MSKKNSLPAEPQSRTLCWECENAVPKTEGARRGGRVLRGCEWSVYGQRVPGWIAKEYQMKMGTKGGVEQFVTSFEVLGCPKFKEG